MATNRGESVVFEGNLGHAPEEATDKRGKTYCKFSVAINSTPGGKPTWVKVNAFGNTARVCLANLDKGDKVSIQGHRQTREWEGKEYTFVTAQEVTKIAKEPQPEATEYTPF